MNAETTKTNHVETAKAQLAAAVARYRGSAQWTELLSAMARNPWHRLSPRRLSFRNQLLVLAQLGLTPAVATYKAWQTAGRNVVKGEHAAWILAPRPVVRRGVEDSDEERVHGIAFRPVAVFGLEQTEGDDLEDPVAALMRIETEEAFDDRVRALRTMALRDLADVVSDVILRPRQSSDPRARGWFVEREGRIVVLTDVPMPEQFRTLVHELAHALLHGRGDHHSTPAREVEAESVAHVVSGAVGLDTSAYSVPYIASWAERAGEGAEVLAAGARISCAANRILEALAAHLHPGEDETPSEADASLAQPWRRRADSCLPSTEVTHA